MTTSLVVNGVLFNYPNSVTDQNWGSAATGWAVAMTNGVLQKGSSGTTQLFTLLSDINFGASFGLQAPYFKSNASGTIGTAGVLRLLNTDTIDWANAAGTADLVLGVNASNQLTFNGSIVAQSGNVVTGPNSSTNFAIPTFNGTTGNLLRNTSVTIDASSNELGAASISATGLGSFGSLAVTGTSTAGSLGISGLITAGSLTVTGLGSAGSLAVTGNGTFGTINSTGTTTTGGLHVTGTTVLSNTATATTVGSTDSSINIATTAFVNDYVQIATQNSQGVKTISASSPSGGNNGDIWYQI